MDKIRPLIAEFIGTFALCFIGIGAIYNFKLVEGGLLAVALAHGLTIAVMVSATAHISGGQLNPAVSFGVWMAGKMTLPEMLRYWAAQLTGAIAAGLTCMLLFSRDAVAAGTPNLAEGISFGAGIAIEAILTFFLVFVVMGTGVDPRGPKIGGLAIGLTVALDILFGGPLTGGAMNPARTFGPGLAAGFWKDHLVYWLGPLVGGGTAGLVYGRFLWKFGPEA